MKRLTLAVAALIILSPVLQAELGPAAYEAMQTKAPEFLEIEVLRVNVEPAQDPTSQTIKAMVLVNKVDRSATSVNPGDIINIVYTLTERPKGWVGPGAIPLLTEKEKTIAYLKKDEASGDFSPVAGIMSFQNF